MRLISVFLTLALTYLSFAAAGRHPKPSPVAAPLAAAAPIQPVIAVFTGPPCSVAGIDLAACGSPNNLATCGVTCNGTVCLGSVNCGDPNALETCGVECINGRCANALNCAALGGECRNGTCSVCGTSADCRGNPEALETCGLNCNAGVCESVNCGNPNNDTTCGVTCTQGDNGLFQCLNALDCTGIQGGTFRCQQQTCVLVSGQTQPPTTPAPITIAPAAPVATQPSGTPVVLIPIVPAAAPVATPVSQQIVIEPSPPVTVVVEQVTGGATETHHKNLFKVMLAFLSAVFIVIG